MSLLDKGIKTRDLKVAYKGKGLTVTELLVHRQRQSAGHGGNVLASTMSTPIRTKGRRARRFPVKMKAG